MRSKIGTRLIDSLKSRETPYEVYDTCLRGFLVRIQPSGSMSYVCSYRLPGGRRNRLVLGRVSLFTPSQARDWASDILTAARKGIDPAASRKAVKAESLQVFIDQIYGPWVKTHRKAGEATLSRIKVNFLEIMKKPLSDLNPWLIEKWRVERLKGGLKPVSVNRELSALRSALSKAVEWGLLEVHPLAKVKPFRTDRRGVVRFLTEDEEIQLREALDYRQETIRVERNNANHWRRERDYPMLPDLEAQPFVDHLKPLVVLSLNTGLRRGELFQLRWENIDFILATLAVIGATAKSGNTRHIPLNMEALQTLRAWSEQQGMPGRGLVFSGKGGGPLVDIKKAWKNLLIHSEIENFRWHDLRHHFASKLVMVGVDLNTVRELLGHSDITMTLRYAHLAPHVKAAAVEKLNRKGSTEVSHATA